MRDARVRIQTILNRTVTADIQKGMTEGYKFLGQRELKYGYEFCFQIPIGRSILDVEAQVDALYASLNAPIELVNYAGRVGVVVVVSDFPQFVPYKEKHLRQDGLIIGYNRHTLPIYHPLNTHLLLGGASGSGKTEALKYYIWQLWLQGYDIRICDLKGFSFMPFEVLPGITVARNLDESLALLEKAKKELDDRKQKVIDVRKRSIIDTFQPVAIIIDEAAALAPSQNTGDMKRKAQYCDNIVSLFGQQGREPKMFVLYACQRPDMTVINKQYKANIEAAIAFRVKTEVNSRIILDRQGAEKISVNHKGRCIYAYDKDHELQVPFIGKDEDWEKLLMPFRTELIADGNSNRTESPRVTIEGSYRPSSPPNQSGGVIVPFPSKAPQNGKQTPCTASERKDGRESEKGRLNENMETQQQGEEGNGSTDHDSTPFVDED